MTNRPSGPPESSRRQGALLRIACWLPLLLLTACLEFEQQELHLRYDAGADRMDVLFVYRGLYAAESNPMPVQDGKSLIDKALSDLEKVREHGAFAFKSPMNFRVDPAEEAEKDWVSRHIDVEYGGLFTDPKGRLCGYQFVRVRDFGAFLPRFAREHQELLFSQFGTAVDQENGWPEAAREAFASYVEQGGPVITADGCSFEMHLPIREQDHAPIRRYVLGDLSEGPVAAKPVASSKQPDASPRRVTRKGVGGARPASPKPNDLTVRREGDVTVVRYGAPGAVSMRVEVACGEGDTKLLDELRVRGEPIEAGVPDQALLRRFAAFGERDAKLPPRLARLRRAGKEAPR